MTIISVCNNQSSPPTIEQSFEFIDNTRFKLVNSKIEIDISATETLELIKLAFVNVSLSCCVTHDQFKRSNDGPIEDDHRPGVHQHQKHLITLSNGYVQNKLRTDQQFTVREVGVNEVRDINWCLPFDFLQINWA